jgi:glycosyltransferase involved in cell wall biosynthesis
MTIALTMLVKDCAENLEGLLAEIAPYFDQRIFVLGGKSRDGTAKVAKKYATDLVRFDWCDDYAAARNAGLEKVATDFWFWLDGDDRVRGIDQLPRLLEHMEKQGLGRLDLQYEYAYDEYGHPTVIHTRERILRTKVGWRWRDRIHEHAWTDAEHRIGLEMGLVICHQRKADPNLPERLRLLNLMAANDEGNPARCTMLLGDVYACVEDWENALRYFSSYPLTGGSDVEHWHCCLMACNCLLKLNRPAEAHSWAMIAADIAPQFREGWLAMAMSAWDIEHDVNRVLRFCELAEKGEPCPLITFRADEEFLNNLWDAQHHAFVEAQDWLAAAQIAQKAHERWPKHKKWEDVAFICEEQARREAAVDAITAQVDYLVRRYDVCRARKLLDETIPAPFADHPRITVLRDRIDRRLALLKNDQTYRRYYEAIDQSGYVDEWQTVPFARWSWVIDRLVASGATTICEVGSSGGEFCLHAARAGLRVIGIDISRLCLRVAWDRVVEAGLRDSCGFICKGLLELTDSGWHFDAVTCMEVLEHLPPKDLERALDALDSVTNHVFITVPAEFVSPAPGLGDKTYIHGHVREFNLYELRQLVGPRRRIRNLFKVADPRLALVAYANVVLEYETGNIPRPKVAFYLGPSPEYWEPTWATEMGMGGSETAVAAMAKELDKRGYDVTVFAEANGIWDGVNYLPHNRVSDDVHYDLFVSSRRPGLPIVPNADHVWLWEHDTGYPELTSETLENFEKVLVLSEWHKKHTEKGWPFVNGKIAVTSNGIMPELFSPNGRRQRHQFIFCSSPDRGLDVLLGWWPKIREMWPDAELHAYYGWQYYDSGDADAEAKLWKAHLVELLDQPGVRWHGRIGQKELARELGRSQFWLYPTFHRTGTDWHETFCITALEAQAAGCIPITRPIAALPERLIYPECLVDSLEVEPFLERLKWWDELPPADLKERRRRMRAYALKQTWGRVADQWITELSTADVREE